MKRILLVIAIIVGLISCGNDKAQQAAHNHNHQHSESCTHDHDHDHHNHEHLYAEDEDGNEIVFAVERRLEINGKQYIVYYDESEAQPRMQVSELVETADGTELFDVETDEEMALIDEALHNDDEE